VGINKTSVTHSWTTDVYLHHMIERQVTQVIAHIYPQRCGGHLSATDVQDESAVSLFKHMGDASGPDLKVIAINWFGNICR
jgi:hypothetical protein